MRWVDEMERMMDIREIAGPDANPAILEMFKAVGYDAKGSDETPWCGASLGTAMIRAGIDPPRGAAAVNSWKNWGLEVAPRVGAIGVFKGPGISHVGIIKRVTDSHVDLLGGNQSNTVNVSRYKRTHLITCRWPDHSDTVGVPTPKEADAAIRKTLAKRSSKWKATDAMKHAAGGTVAMAAGVEALSNTTGQVQTTLLSVTSILNNYTALIVIGVAIGVYVGLQYLQNRQVKDVQDGRYETEVLT